jgi:hypothetical protein
MVQRDASVHFGTGRARQKEIYIFTRQVVIATNAQISIREAAHTPLAHSSKMDYIYEVHALTLSRLFVLPDAFCAHINATASSLHTQEEKGKSVWEMKYSPGVRIEKVGAVSNHRPPERFLSKRSRCIYLSALAKYELLRIGQEFMVTYA